MPTTNLYSLLDCEKVLNAVKAYGLSSPFLEPVPWKVLGLLSYPTLIKHPMDFGTIGKKLAGGQYSSSLEFCDDMDLVFSNAKTFNLPESEIYAMTEKVEKEYKKQLAKFEPIARQRVKSSGPIEPIAFTESDKRELGKAIAALNSKQLERVIQLIQKHQPNLVKDTTTEIELDINTLTPEFLTELHLHVKNCTKKKKRSRDRDGGPSSKRRKISTTVQ